MNIVDNSAAQIKTPRPLRKQDSNIDATQVQNFSFETTMDGERDPLAMDNDRADSNSVSLKDEEERYVISFEG